MQITEIAVGERLTVLVERAKKDLAEATSFDELKAVRDQMEMLRLMARKVGAALEAYNNTTEFKLRAERMMGAALMKAGLRPGNPQLSNDATIEPPPRLRDIGVNRDQSSRWQALARLPGYEFERYLRETRECGREIRSSDLYTLARNFFREEEEALAETEGRTQKRRTPTGTRPIIDVPPDRAAAGVQVSPSMDAVGNTPLAKTPTEVAPDSPVIPLLLKRAPDNSLVVPLDTGSPPEMPVPRLCALTRALVAEIDTIESDEVLAAVAAAGRLEALRDEMADLLKALAWYLQEVDLLLGKANRAADQVVP